MSSASVHECKNGTTILFLGVEDNDVKEFEVVGQSAYMRFKLSAPPTYDIVEVSEARHILPERHRKRVLAAEALRLVEGMNEFIPKLRGRATDAMYHELRARVAGAVD